MSKVLRKATKTRLDRSKKVKRVLNKVIFVRYFRYDLYGGFPLGHCHEDAAELVFGNKRTIWRIRDAVLELSNFIDKHGKPAGDREPLPYDKDYGQDSYKQSYILTHRFTFLAVIF